jgi:large subunit ribosomal protein L24
MGLGIKKGDKVAVISGADRGKAGKVLKVISGGQRAVVEGVNIVKKHMRRRSESEPSGVKELPASVNVSDLALFCNQCNRGVRFGVKVLEGRNKIRVCKKCQQPIS